MPFKVTYSGLNSNEPGKSPWADIIPYVSVDESRNWSSNLTNKELSVSLQGSLTQSGFNKLTTNYADFGYSSDPTQSLLFPTGYVKILKDSFSKCYGELIATDNPQGLDPTVILSGIYYVDSIEFADQNFIGLINYSVNFKQYNGLKYSGIDPSETIKISEDGNGIVDITHSISAKGVGFAFSNNTPIAFNSVKTFVQDSTGISRLKSLIFGSGFVPTGSGLSGVFVSGNGIGTSHSSNLVLLSQTESINRLDNSYGVEELFRIDNLRSSQYATKRFSVDLNSGIADDYIVVNVKCDIQGAKDKNFSNVSGELNNITGQMYNAATGIVSSDSLLCKTPIAFSIDTTRLITGFVDGSSITESNGSSSFSASCSFDNSSESTFFDYSVSFSSDEITNVTSLNINGEIKGRGLHASQKFNDASGYLFTTLLTDQQDVKTMLFDKATGAFKKIAPTTTNAAYGTIGERAGESFGFVKDKGNVSFDLNTGNGTITLQGSFSDEDGVSGYNNFTWNSSVTVGVPMLVIKPSYIENGFNIIQDLGVTNQTSYNLNGSFEFVSGADGTIPILTKASQPHTGILKKLLSAEGFPSTINSKTFTDSGFILDNYSKTFDFVSGTASNSNDYLSSGFDVNLARPKQNTLPVYSTYSVT